MSILVYLYVNPVRWRPSVSIQEETSTEMDTTTYVRTKEMIQEEQKERGERDRDRGRERRKERADAFTMTNFFTEFHLLQTEPFHRITLTQNNFMHNTIFTHDIFNTEANFYTTIFLNHLLYNI